MTHKWNIEKTVQCEVSEEVADLGSEPISVSVNMVMPDGTMKSVCGDASDLSVFKSGHDINRNDQRREKHKPAIANETERPLSPEEFLFRKEEEENFRLALCRVFGAFATKDHARTILFHALAGIEFSDTKGLAAISGLSVPEVTAAKRKIQRRIPGVYGDMNRLLRRSDQEKQRSGS